MFIKHIFIGVIILSIIGYFNADRIFYWQGEYMEGRQYYLSAYEAYARIPKYYPNSSLVRKAKDKMEHLRTNNWQVKDSLSKTEKVLQQSQKKREATESYR